MGNSANRAVDRTIEILFTARHSHRRFTGSAHITWIQGDINVVCLIGPGHPLNDSGEDFVELLDRRRDIRRAGGNDVGNLMNNAYGRPKVAGITNPEPRRADAARRRWVIIQMVQNYVAVEDGQPVLNHVTDAHSAPKRGLHGARFRTLADGLRFLRHRSAVLRLRLLNSEDPGSEQSRPDPFCAPYSHVALLPNNARPSALPLRLPVALPEFVSLFQDAGPTPPGALLVGCTGPDRDSNPAPRPV